MEKACIFGLSFSLRVTPCTPYFKFVHSKYLRVNLELKAMGTPDEISSPPDVMAKKMRGRSGKIFAQKSRNSGLVNGRGCGFVGKVDSRLNSLQY